MELTDWLKRRLVYIQKAQERDQQRLNLGAQADEDIPYYVKTVEEAIMDVLDRLERIETLYTPAPKEAVDRSPNLRFLPGKD